MSNIDGELIFPPTDGTILLPDTLAFHRRYNPNAPMYLFNEDGIADIFEVSYSQFDRGCDRVARAIGADIDFSTRPIVALLALVDTLLYQTIVVGLISAGFIPFPISPRNSAAAIAHLLKSTSCHHILATCITLKDLVADTQGELLRTDPAYLLKVREIPSLFEIFPELSDNPMPPHELEAQVEPLPVSLNRHKLGLDDVALYLHSSGSTGFPKPIPKTHRNLLQYVLSPCCMVFLNHPKRVRMPGMQLPPFHALGFVLETPGIIPTVATHENTLDHMRRTNCNALVSIPAFLQAWAKETHAINILRGLELVMYGGGSVSQKLGDFLIENGIILHNVYGGTEVGGPAYSSLREDDKKEWEYIEFIQNCDVRWVSQGDGTYECHLYDTPTYRLSIHNLPNAGYATSDLFRRHPTKDYLWKFAGRLDDVILHSSGEKTVTPPLEGVLISSPYIIGVVMFGNGHDQPGVLIEPSLTHEIDVADVHQVAQFRNLIWHVIDEANKIAPRYSKIFKELILIVDRRKPLPRAPKGTVIRKLALSAYSEEIDAVYRSIESAQITESIQPPQVWEEQFIVRWLLDQARELCPGKIISASDNLFEQGLDSLSVTILRRRILSALQSIDSRATIAESSFAQNAIYTHPTINTLARHILDCLHNSGANEQLIADTHIGVMEEMIRRYKFSDQEGAWSRSHRSTSHQGKVVLLTGSTGHLGSQILEGLLRDPKISRVYTLSRPSASQCVAERHRKRFFDKGLDEELLESPKIVHLETEYSKAKLGLSQERYCELSNCIDIVIHVAWRLDFNLSLASFESHIRGTHNLIELARSRLGQSDIKFIFTSSVSTAQSWDQHIGHYPEELVMDAKYAVGLGYGESKYVTERILASSGLNATSLRIGQVTGSSNGAWATSDWIPILVKSSLELGCLPSVNGNVSWIPMDAVCDCIFDLIALDGRYPEALNIVHPRVVKWDMVMEYITEALRLKYAITLPLVSFQNWVELLGRRSIAPQPDDLRRIPAIKLQDFFKQLCGRNDNSITSQSQIDKEVFGAAEFSTTKMEGISKNLSTVAPLMQEDINRWIKYWDNSQYFD